VQNHALDLFMLRTTTWVTVGLASALMLAVPLRAAPLPNDVRPGQLSALQARLGDDWTVTSRDDAISAIRLMPELPGDDMRANVRVLKARINQARPNLSVDVTGEVVRLGGTVDEHDDLLGPVHEFAQIQGVNRIVVAVHRE
jgi:hypothetical protein